MLVSKVRQTESNNTGEYVVRYKKKDDSLTQQDEPQNGSNNGCSKV